jgi:hypothetical protein
MGHDTLLGLHCGHHAKLGERCIELLPASGVALRLLESHGPWEHERCAQNGPRGAERCSQVAHSSLMLLRADACMPLTSSKSHDPFGDANTQAETRRGRGDVVSCRQSERELGKACFLSARQRPPLSLDAVGGLCFVNLSPCRPGLPSQSIQLHFVSLT